MLLLVDIPSTVAYAQQPKISGYMFGDAYAIAAHDDRVLEDEVEPLTGNSGLWFRRIYLTMDFQISSNWKARLRTEMNSPGDFTSRSTLDPFAKDAYVQWKNDQHQVSIGLAETPTWTIVEKVWGYRSVEKTLVDLQRIGSSRDIGVDVRGALSANGKVGYNVMISNGDGTRSETNKGKKVMGALSFNPTDAWVFEAYSDYDNRQGETDRFTLQGFAGYQSGGSRFGLQYVYQRREVEAVSDLELRAISIFGVTKLTEKITGFARFDKMFDPNPDAGRIAYLPFNADASSNLLLFGIDYQVNENVHFMPNTEVVFYDKTNGFSPDATVMPRITFFVTFG